MVSFVSAFTYGVMLSPAIGTPAITWPIYPAFKLLEDRQTVDRRVRFVYRLIIIFPLENAKRESDIYVALVLFTFQNAKLHFNSRLGEVDACRKICLCDN